MFNKLSQFLKSFDWILLSAIILLLSVGLAEIYSVALGQNDLNLLNFKKQIFFVILGLILFFVFASIDPDNYKSFSNIAYIVGIATLLGVLVFGTSVRGTKGWFDIGPFRLQPVEFIKIILILFLAKYFSTAQIKLNPLKHFLLSGLASFVLVFLILIQPDFGSGLLLIGIWSILIFVSGIKKRYFFIIVLSGLIALSAGWLFFFKDYQKDRIMTFLNPQERSLNEGYNVTQAMIAVGSGGIMGRGIGFGSQSQLKFLPESQNDFIFAVIAEELGFLGVSLVIAFFSIFFYRCLANLKHVKHDFGVFFILGAVGLIFIEMFINIGMNIGILPVVGISLPFLSYGGSSIISTLILAGIIESIIIKTKISH